MGKILKKIPSTSDNEVIMLLCRCICPGSHGPQVWNITPGWLGVGSHEALVVFYTQQMANRRQWEDETDEPGREERSGGLKWANLSLLGSSRSHVRTPTRCYSVCITKAFTKIKSFGFFFFDVVNPSGMQQHWVKIQHHLFSDNPHWPARPSTPTRLLWTFIERVA